MTAITLRFPDVEQRRSLSVALEIVSLAVGVSVTLGLFLGIAHFKGRRPAPAEEVQPLRVLSALPEPLPPKLTEELERVEEPVPFAGLTVDANDSSVKIAVVPPDLATVVPVATIPPSAVVQFSQPLTDLKPRVDVVADFRHVYRQAEVDQRVTVLSRPDPIWPRSVSKDLRSLRVTFLLIVNTNGKAENVRLLNSSGCPEFDRAVQEQIQAEWIFSPAMKNRQKVRCLVEQAVVVSNAGQSRFHL